MRQIKELFVLFLLGLLGAVCGWWCLQIFGGPATSELLKWGSVVTSGFLLAMKRLNAAFGEGASLSEFDVVTRERFDSALNLYRKRFRIRMIFGIALSGLALVVGVLVGKSATLDADLASILSITASAALTISAAMVAIQLWVSSWPAEFLAAIRRAGASQIARKKALDEFSITKEEPL